MDPSPGNRHGLATGHRSENGQRVDWIDFRQLGPLQAFTAPPGTAGAPQQESRDGGAPNPDQLGPDPDATVGLTIRRLPRRSRSDSVGRSRVRRSRRQQTDRNRFHYETGWSTSRESDQAQQMDQRPNHRYPKNQKAIAYPADRSSARRPKPKCQRSTQRRGHPTRTTAITRGDQPQLPPRARPPPLERPGTSALGTGEIIASPQVCRHHISTGGNSREPNRETGHIWPVTDRPVGIERPVISCPQWIAPGRNRRLTPASVPAVALHARSRRSSCGPPPRPPGPTRLQPASADDRPCDAAATRRPRS